MLEVWGGCQPARTVSGDYYDYVTLSGNRVALAIGDISGKGISAALLMAHIQSALRSQLMPRNAGNGAAPESSISPAEVLSILNNLLYTSSPAEKYATFFLGIYADQGGQLIYTNAGHIAPMLVRRNQVLRLAGDGFPVGLFPGVQYEQHSVMLEHHDLFVAFTDGVTETPNVAGEEFGEQRVMDLLTKNVDRPLDVIAGEISKTVSAWAGGQERHDDTTVLLARRI
jgi:sigma-B regulation protein RsbU (phosphoserine phosphatase)